MRKSKKHKPLQVVELDGPAVIDVLPNLDMEEPDPDEDALDEDESCDEYVYDP